MSFPVPVLVKRQNVGLTLTFYTNIVSISFQASIYLQRFHSEFYTTTKVRKCLNQNFKPSLTLCLVVAIRKKRTEEFKLLVELTGVVDNEF